MIRKAYPFASALALVGLLTAANCHKTQTTTNNMPPPPPASVMVAKQITQPTELLKGPHAMGGLGDWLLANDVVQAVVDDVKNQNLVATSGGELIDFTTVGGNNDWFNQLFQIFMVSQDYPLVYDTITASSDDTSASITVTGHVFVANPKTDALDPTTAAGLHVTTTYKLLKGDPTLHLHTEMTNTNSMAVSGPEGTPLMDVILWGTRNEVPFVPYRGRGYTQPPLDISSPFGAFGGYLYVGSRCLTDPPVSYALVAPSLKDALLVGVNDEQLSALGQEPLGPPIDAGQTVTYDRQLLIGPDKTIQSVADQAFKILAAQAPTQVSGVAYIDGQVTGLAPGRTAEVIAEIAPTAYLGPQAMNAVTVSGDGKFHFTLPVQPEPVGSVNGVDPDKYQLTLNYGANAPVTVGPMTITAGQTIQAPPLAAPALATLNYTITSDGQGKPARLTLKGVGNTPDPQLGSPDAGAVSQNLVYSLNGMGSVAVEPGTYDIYASRGIEYSVAHQQVTLTAGQSQTVSFAISKIVQTPGMLAGDFHVHSGNSFDASVDLQTRILTYAAEGMEVLASTDHNFITDYTDAVAALGLQGQIGTIIGEEATSNVPMPQFPHTIGHYNAWPLLPNPMAPRQGAPLADGVEPGELFDRLKAAADGTPVLELNHARDPSVGTIGLGYFSDYGFSPIKPIPTTDDGSPNSFLRRNSPLGTQNVDFDAFEVQNGAYATSVPTNQQLRDDWFSLLKQGFLKAGMANSDSHVVAPLGAGYPRTYVAYAPDSPKPLTTGDASAAAEIAKFDASIRGMHVMGTNGPIVLADIEGHGAGETVPVMTPGNVTVHVHVEAAPWMPVSEVRILVNGELACSVDALGTMLNTPAAVSCPAALAATPEDPFGTSSVVFYDQMVVLNVTRDAFIVVEAGSKLPIASDTDGDGMLDTWDTNGDGVVDSHDKPLAQGGYPTIVSPPVAAALMPGILPWGFTNPILVDIGGDGWTPPGL